MRITVGARGPGEVVELEFSPPTGMDLTAVTRDLLVTLDQSSQAPIVLSPWTTVSVTASLWTVRFSPTGSEFVALGSMRLTPDLTLDGTVYRYSTVTGTIGPR